MSCFSSLFSFLSSIKKTELERSCVLIREKMKTVNPRLNQLAETNGIGLGFSRLYFPSCFFFFSPPPRWKNEAANWIQVTPFFSSIYHPYTLSLLLDQPIVVRNGQRDSTWKIIRIECGYFPSPLARIFIFFSAFGNVGKRSSIVIILFNPV